MITKDNYIKEVERIGMDSLPQALKDGHNFLMKATSNGTVWESSSPKVNEVIALQMEKLDSFLKDKGNQAKKKKQPTSKAKVKSKSTSKSKPINTKVIAKKQSGKKSKKVAKPLKKIAKPPITVKKYALELQHIKRFAGFHGKDHKTSYVQSLHTSIQNHLAGGDYLNHIPMLEDISNRLEKGLEQAKKENAAIMSISIEPGFKEKVHDLIANAKVRIRTEFLAGINSESRSKKQS